MAAAATLGLAACCLAAARPAAAQRLGPIPRFAVDAHVSTPAFKDDAAIATPRGVAASDLPERGLGFDIGAHLYPIRLEWITFGLGGSLHVSGAGKDAVDTEEGVPGHGVSASFRAFAPQISFNFGHSRGWSYLSGGIGTSTLRYTVDDLPLEDGSPGRKTINYGGGARWFARDHVAFSFDVRFYAINPQAEDPEQGLLDSPRMTLLVLSAGVSFK
ncbi:MAG: outer membrane beta-barrel protein [Vicinamibacterales bacterium]